MVKIYRARGKGTYEERIVSTDAKDLRAFEEEFADALMALFDAEHFHVVPDGITAGSLYPKDAGEVHFSNNFGVTLQSVIPRAFQLAFKLAGYKTDMVHEQRLLIAGTALPDDKDIIVTAGNEESPRLGPAALNGNLESQV